MKRGTATRPVSRVVGLLPPVADADALHSLACRIHATRTGRGNMASIEIGAEVVTSDGTVLGSVKKVESSAFQVDAPRRVDYWLEANVVKSANSARVQLLISDSDVVSYRMDRPHDLTAFQEKGVDPQVLNRKANPRG